MVLRGRLTAAAVTAATAALLLAGCAGQPNVAAVVDGRTITERELDQVHDDLESIQPVDTIPLLRAMILAPVITRGAEAAGVGVSDAEALGSLQQSVVDAGGASDREFAPATIDLRRSEIALAKIETLPEGQQIFEELFVDAQALDVELNPRYGSYGEEDLSLTPESFPWIVAPTP
ncbi:MAG: hypothetical protein JWP95_204 [Actinotalea sp.]|nr:hypothetical protein [Actinotalea sp.]